MGGKQGTSKASARVPSRRLALGPSRDATPHEVQPAQLLRYLPVHQVLVCIPCQYAIQPNAIPRHLKEIHHILRSRRRPFVEYASRFNLLDPRDVATSRIQEFPVPLLPVESGLRCDNEGCGHLCVSVKRMKHHWISAHQRHGEASLDWGPAPLQTFFRGTFLRYFSSSSAVSKDNNLDMYHDMKTGKHKLPHNRLACNLPVESSRINLSHETPPSSIDALYPDDFDLLHNYLKSTYLTIATDSETEELWKTTVPQLAHQHPFLMHGVLACSALHLAHTDPLKRREHMINASTHQDRAMPAFRSAISNVNKENCHAVLVFTHLLVIYSFAVEGQDERLLLVGTTGDELLPNWLYFLRGGCSMLCSVWSRIETGPVKALSSAWEREIEVPEICKTSMVEDLPSVMSSLSTEEGWPQDVCAIYEDAAAELGWAFSCTRALGESFTTWDALRIWPMRISVGYMALLRNRHPGALILLAYYCVLLKNIESHWFFEGRATRLMSVIINHLEAKWHRHVQAPLDEIETFR